jgi:hypothetical protein
MFWLYPGVAARDGKVPARVDFEGPRVDDADALSTGAEDANGVLGLIAKRHQKLWEN